MTEVDIAQYRRRGQGPTRDMLKQCHSATGYLADNSLVLLKDAKERNWFLSNDSSHTDVRVVVRFRLPRATVEAYEKGKSVASSLGVLPITCPKEGSTVVTQIKARGGASPAHASTGEDAYVYVRAVATVFARQTIPFLTLDEAVGSPEAVFDFESEQAGMSVSDVVFRVNPDWAVLRWCKRVYPCFRNEDNGSAEMLYRLVCGKPREDGETWAFYNDSTDHNITVSAAFTNNAEAVKPLGRTRILDADDAQTSSKHRSAATGGEDAWIAQTEGSGHAIHLQLTVPPRTTEAFLSGTLLTLPELSFVASATSNEKPEYDAVHFTAGGPDAAITEYDQLFKCYPDRGNGLLFHLVDTTGKQWAFYNDTAKYTFTVTAVFPPEEEARFARGPTVSMDVAGPQPSSRRAASMPPPPPPSAGNGVRRSGGGGNGVRQASEATTRGRAPPPPPGSRVLTMGIAPGETLLFLRGGLPVLYQLSFQRERATAARDSRHASSDDEDSSEAEGPVVDDASSVDEEELSFVGPGPSKAAFPYAKIFRTPDANVFRLVNEKGDAWAFYNDSPSTHAFVAAKFTGVKGAFRQDLSPGVAPMARATLIRVQRSTSSAIARLDITGSSDGDQLSQAATTPVGYPRLRRAASQEPTPLSTPQRGRRGMDSSTTTTTSAAPGLRGEGNAAAATYCSEVYASVACGETLPFSRAVKLHAMQRYLLFIRSDPAPTEGGREQGGNKHGRASAATDTAYMHPSAAGKMLRVAKPNRILPCFRDLNQTPLLYHVEEGIPSPTIAAAAARQHTASSSLAAASAEEEEALVLLTEAEETALLLGRPARWHLFNDSDKYCFLVTYQLDGRSNVRTLGHAWLRQRAISAGEARSSRNGSARLLTHSALSPQPSSSNNEAPVLPQSLLGTRPHASRLEGDSFVWDGTGSMSDIPVAAMRSPLDRTIDEVYYNDFALENSHHRLAAREGSASSLLVCTIVVDPLATVPVLEGEIVGGVTLTVRVDEARENRLVTFNNGHPRIYASEAQFLEETKSAASTATALDSPLRASGLRDSVHSGSRRPREAPSIVEGESFPENMLENPQLRFYRMMPKRFNGLLFRVVDDSTKLWAFFNDTTNYRFTVRVLFLKGSRVEVVGHAREVTEWERRQARLRKPSALAAAAGPDTPQRRLSSSRARSTAAANIAAAASSSHGGGEGPLNFFSDPTYAKDETARLVEVDVDPGATELLVHATDVVRFRVSWVATPVVLPTPTSESE